MNNETKSIQSNNSPNPINTYLHMKTNILNQNDNCKHPISDDSYYCITCKKSTCVQCDFEIHKTHQIILKKNVYHIDANFLSEFSYSTTKTDDIDILKKEAFDSLEKNFSKMRNELENLYHLKKSEIEKLFNFAVNNMNKLKDNYVSLQRQVTDFYQLHNNFFQIDSGANPDEQNSVFLLKYDLIDIIEHQNSKTLKGVFTLKENLLKYKNEISNQSNRVLQSFFDNFKDEFVPFTEQFEVPNFYEGINKRINTYNEKFHDFKVNLSKGFNQTGNFKNLGEIIKKLDAKNKRGIESIYNQKSIEYNSNFECYQPSQRVKSPKNSKTKKMQVETTLDILNKKLNKPTTARELDFSNKNMKPIDVKSPNNLRRQLMITKKSKTNLTKTSEKAIKTSNNTSSTKMYRSKSSSVIPNKTPDSIILDNYTVQRFFAYFITDVYNNNFSPKSPRKSFDVNSRVYAQYQERLISLKESAKPIIGKNEIVLYSDLKKGLVKIKVNLTKELHGYTVFPEGTRHILINDNLYITGGVDSFGNPLSICLMYNIHTQEIRKITDTIFPHSYHAIEYLENYDCVIILGGERNSTCEMLDIKQLTWTALPDLAYPRANICVIFNEKASELYAMFGMNGSIYDKNNFSDIIEVIKICDAADGWIKVDYYKNSMIDLSSNYVTAFPFTLDKLIIRGTRNNRSNAISYCIYDMLKNEMSFASEKTVQQIQEEEVKIKAYSKALIINKKI